MAQRTQGLCVSTKAAGDNTSSSTNLQLSFKILTKLQLSFYILTKLQLQIINQTSALTPFVDRLRLSSPYHLVCIGIAYLVPWSRRMGI